jgi:DNA anti-recombination protein RmuC
MEILLGVVVVLLVAVVALQVFLLRAQHKPELELKPLQAQLEAIERAQERAEHVLHEEVGRNRDEFGKQALSNRQELQATLTHEFTAISTAQHSRLELLGQQLAELNHAVDDKLAGVRSTTEARLQAITDSLTLQLGGMRDTVDQVRASLEERELSVILHEAARP